MIVPCTYRTLLQVHDGNKVIRVSYHMNQEVALYLNDTFMLSLSVENGDWKVIALTLNFTSDKITLLTGSNSSFIEVNNFIEHFSEVNVGAGFSGLLQDIQVYDSPLQGLKFPSRETFLPRCYCRSNSSTTNSNQCSEDNKRYVQYMCSTCAVQCLIN